MKKIFKTLAIVAVAALGLTACENDINEQIKENEGEKVTVEVVGTVADLTRSTFGEINTTDGKVPSTWSGNEIVGFSAAEATPVTATNTTAGATASFSVEFASIADGDTVYAVSPYQTGSWALGGFTGISASNDDFYVTIPVEQTPLATSVDESAHLMIGQATYEEGSAMTMTFNHVAAYGKMNITNFAGNGVKSIEMTFPVNVAGQGAWCYYAGENVGTIANLKSNTITINPEKVTNVANGVWFIVAPVGALVGDLKIVVTDDNDDTYTKTIKLTAEKGISFVKGQVSNFTVNMEDVAVDGDVEGSWNKITELSQLTDGCQAIIVAENGDKYYALTANGTNRPTQTEVKVTSDAIENSYIEDAMILTVGVSDGNYTFQNGSAYLVSNSNTTPNFKTSGNTTFGVTANGDYFNVQNTSDSRYIALYTSGTDWRAYTSLTQSNSVPSLSFYVKDAQPDNRLESSLTFNKSEIEVDLKNGIPTDFTESDYTLTPAGGELTWSSDNAEVATVDAEGNVTIEGATGTAVITATFAGNGSYKGCSAEYTIKVTDSSNVGSEQYTVVKDIANLTEGTYYIVTETNYLYNGAINSGHLQCATAAISTSGAITIPDGAVAVTLTSTGADNSYYIKDANGKYITATKASSGGFSLAASDSYGWTFSNVNSYLLAIYNKTGAAAHFRSYNNSFRTYGNNTNKAFYLVKVNY